MQEEYPEIIVQVEICSSAVGTGNGMPADFQESFSAMSVFELKFERFGVYLMVNYVGQGREELSGERQHERQMEGREHSVSRTCNSIAVIFSGRKCQKVSRGITS